MHMNNLLAGQNEAAKEQLDNQHNAEAQRERYYATIHKVALQAGEKIPGTLYYINPFVNNRKYNLNMLHFLQQICIYCLLIGVVF